MLFKIFGEADPKKIIQVVFSTEKKIIKEFVTLMNQGY
jgi:hypothetical protein